MLNGWKYLGWLGFVLCLSSCGTEQGPAADVQSSNNPPAKIEAPAESKLAVASDPADTSNTLKPPATLSDVKSALRLAEDLRFDASVIANEPRCEWDNDAPAHLDLLREEITPLRNREEQLKNQIIDIKERAVCRSPGTDLKIMRVALVAENIGLADTWLWSALDAEAFSKPSRAKTYLKGMKAALDRAEKLVSGKFRIDPDDPDSAVLSIPKYIEIADQQT